MGAKQSSNRSKPKSKKSRRGQPQSNSNSQLQGCVDSATLRWRTQTRRMSVGERLNFYRQEKQRVRSGNEFELRQVAFDQTRLKEVLESRLDANIAECEERISDSKRILDAAMKAGTVRVSNTNVLIVGSAGTGKTCTKYLVYGKPPPIDRVSTPLIQSPVRSQIRPTGSELSTHDSLPTVESNSTTVNVEIHDASVGDVSTAEPTTENDPSADSSDQGTLSRVRSVAGGMVQAGEYEWEFIESASFLQKIIAENTNPESITDQFRPRSILTSSFRLRDRTTSLSRHDTEATSRQGTDISSQARHDFEATSRQGTDCSPETKQYIGEIYGKIVEIVQKNTGETSHKTFDDRPSTMGSNWVYFIDSGGQPHFYNLLPHFIHGISIVLFTHRLCDKLDAHPQVEYYGNEQRLHVCYESPFSVRDTLMRLVNSMQCHTVNSRKPRLMFIGTFHDKIEESGETLEEKNEQLKELLVKDYRSQLVFNGEQLDKLIFAVDAKNPGAQEQVVANSIRRSIKSSRPNEDPIPTSWYVLGLSLDELAQKLNRKVLSKSECLEVAQQLKMSEQKLTVALEFLHKKHLLHYYPYILPNVIFTSTQVLLDKLTELVVEAYRLRGLTIERSTSEQESTTSALAGHWHPFRDEGIITLQLLEEDNFDQHYVHSNNLFSASDLLNIFTNLLILAPLSEGENIFKSYEAQFYMPSLLDTLPPSELEKYRTRSSSQIEPIVLCLSKDSPRLGVFCCVQVFLLQHGWKLAYDFTKPKLIAQNCVILLHSKLPCTITLIDSFSYIEVHVATELPDKARLCKFIRRDTLDAIKESNQALNYKLKDQVELAFFCPCGQSSSHAEQSSSPSDSSSALASLPLSRHIAYVKGDFLNCSVKQTKFLPMTDEHRVWRSNLDTTALGDPNTPILNIDTHLCAVWRATFQAKNKWKAIGRVLGLNPSDLESISTQYQNDGPDECLYHMLSKWMRSGGATITELLRAFETDVIGHKDIANEIRARQGNVRSEVGLN